MTARSQKPALAIRIVFFVSAVGTVGLDAGYLYLLNGQHHPGGIGARATFILGFVLLLAVLAALAGFMRWEVAAPLGTASTSGLFWVGAVSIFTIGLSFILAAVLGATQVLRLVRESSPHGWRGGTGLICGAAAIVPAAVFLGGLFLLK